MQMRESGDVFQSLRTRAWQFLEDYLAPDSVLPDGYSHKPSRRPHRDELAGWLESIIQGRPPTKTYEMRPYLRLRLTNAGAVLLGLEEGSSGMVADHAILAALLLWADPTRRALLRRCGKCGRFFLAKRNHRRGQSFCSDGCRTAYHGPRRSKARHAEGERQRLKARRAMTRARKRSI